MSYLACCVVYFNAGDSICPVCNEQEEAYRQERLQAQAFRPKLTELSTAAVALTARNAIPPVDFRVGKQGPYSLLQKNPNRRRVFELFNFYLPEREAKELLKNIHDYKWIEAEKVGFDLWSVEPVPDPFVNAAFRWARQYLPVFLQHRPLQAP